LFILLFLIETLMNYPRFRVGAKTGWGWLAIFSASLLSSFACAGVAPSRAELSRKADVAGVSLDFPAPVKYKVFSLREPNRIVIDLDGVDNGPSLDRLVSGISTGDPDIARVRVGHPAFEQTRIVLDFKGAVPKVETVAQAVANGGQRLTLTWLSSGKKLAQAAPVVSDTVTASASEPAAKSGSAWRLRASPLMTFGSYSQSSIRKNFLTSGVMVDAQYLERGGVAVAATHTTLNYSNGSAALAQNTGFVSGRMNFTPDRLPGTLTVRGDIHQISNNDPTNETNRVSVIAPQLSYLNFDKTQYFDLGYAYSSYGDSNVGNPSLSVKQLTPTVGFALNQGADWLQFRLYDIRFAESARTQNKSATDALEAKWTHYMTQQRWMPEQVQASALVGSRLYAVDSDAASVYNLADMQKGSVGVGAQWKVAPSVQLQLNGGYSRYEALVGGVSTTYSGSHLYTGVNAQW
jgi:hypothetical protein